MNRIQNPITSDVVDYNLIEFIMRIDQNSGEVVWAKSYAFQSISFALVYNHMKIINQVIWTLKTINDQDFARGLITKLDENGDVLENFVILDVMTKNITVKPFVQSPPKRPRSVQFWEGGGLDNGY